MVWFSGRERHTEDYSNESPQHPASLPISHYKFTAMTVSRYRILPSKVSTILVRCLSTSLLVAGFSWWIRRLRRPRKNVISTTHRHTHARKNSYETELHARGVITSRVSPAKKKKRITAPKKTCNKNKTEKKHILMNCTVIRIPTIQKVSNFNNFFHRGAINFRAFFTIYVSLLYEHPTYITASDKLNVKCSLLRVQIFYTVKIISCVCSFT